MYSHPKGKARKAKIFNDTNDYPKLHLILLSKFHLYRILESRKRAAMKNQRKATAQKNRSQRPYQILH
jgi:hypothetical protein